MIVFSPLALYTTYLGWQQYDVLFDALWQTGVLYIGFLAIAIRFLKNVLAPSGSTHHAAEHALNTFLYELAVTFFVCAMFVYPAVPLQQKGITFKPLCSMQKTGEISTSTLKDTGTTYDEAFADVLAESVKIPIGFSFIQNATSAFTYGMMKVTGCTDSLQSIEGDLISTYIPEDIRKLAMQFHKQCFLEARSLHANEARTDVENKKVREILKKHGGEEDLNWMGSKTFRTLYYGKLKAREPIAGFKYEQYPSSHFNEAAETDDAVKAHTPVNGYPDCNQWWNKIQTDLVDVAEKASYFDRHLGKFDVSFRVSEYRSKHKKTWNSDLTPQDYIARVLLQDNRDLQNKSAEALIDPTNGTMGTVVSRSLVSIGQAVKANTSTILKREATIQSLPVMHAFFTFFLIVFTPIVLALSGYSVRALGSICGLFIISIFVQCIWHYVSFLERSVIDPLGESDSVSAMRNMAVLFYYGAPLLLFKLSSHFGGEAVAGLAGMAEISKDASARTSESGLATAKIGVVAARKFAGGI